MSESHKKNPGRVVSGLKASINNPNVSEDAKNRARARLSELGASEDTAAQTKSITDQDEIEEGDFEADDEGYDDSAPSSGSLGVESEETEHRRLGGYKATIHNPRVSKEAKDHARQILEENDAL